VDDLEQMVPADIQAEVDAIYSQQYDFNDARVPGEQTKTTKGKAAAVMAVSGADFEEIAGVLGFPSARHAELATQRALADSLDTWDKADLRRLFTNRFEALFRGGLRRSQTKGYFAREAAAKTALQALVEQIKFLGMAAPSEHVVHSPAAREIEIIVRSVTEKAISALPAEVDVLDAEVVSDEPV
jgi:hypothetical protein